MTVIDADQHLVESRTMWREHIDPGDRDDALEIVDDDAGHPWLTWRGEKLGLAEVQTPGETDAIGERKARPAGASHRRCATTTRSRSTTGIPTPARRACARWASTRRCCSPTTA
jgi:hypothetical protein